MSTRDLYAGADFGYVPLRPHPRPRCKAPHHCGYDAADVCTCGWIEAHQVYAGWSTWSKEGNTASGYDHETGDLREARYDHKPELCPPYSGV